MKPALVYRIAAALLFLFFAGHTVGTFAGRSPAPAAGPVLDGMKAVHFDFHGSLRTFYEIFFGHGLLVSLFLLSSAVAAWRLSTSDVQRSAGAAWSAWWLFAVGLGTAGVAWRYFFIGPAVISTLAAACLGVGALGTSRVLRLGRDAD